MTARFGSISTGTLRSEDLVPAFRDELESHIDSRESMSPEESRLLRDARLWTECVDRYGDDFTAIDNGAELVNELIDALQAYAPPYGYFGAHPGDGSDFGFWLSESFEDDFDGLKVSDTSEVPADYVGEVLHVNDHGNATLYLADKGELKEIWAVV